MPIHVDIRINDQLLNQVHITRVRGNQKPDSFNDYLVIDGDYPTRMEDWLIDGVPFSHRYGDGAEICVMKGMEALYGKLD
jgi:hypothetical protein